MTNSTTIEYKEIPVHGIPELVFTILACLVSLSLFIGYPLPTVWKLYRRTITDEWLPYPFVASTLNNAVWFVFCFIMENDWANHNFDEDHGYSFHMMCLTFTSLLVFAVQELYIIVYDKYVQDPLKKKIMMLVLLSCVTVSLVLVVGSLLYGISRSSGILGPIGVVTGIVMYVSPVMLILEARSKDDTGLLPVWPCVGFLMNGLSWFIVAFLGPKLDVYLAITHGVGVGLLVLQLGFIFVHLRLRVPQSSGS